MLANMNYQKQLCCWWNFGHSSNKDEDRRIGRNLKGLGWPAWVEQNVQTRIAEGWKLYELHNPFGCIGGVPMAFDQQAEAMSKPEWDWVHKGFVAAWKPITDSGCKVFSYLGSLKSDEEMSNLQENDPAGYIQRVAVSLSYSLQAGCEIIFDHLGGQDGVSATHPSMAIMDLLDSLGVDTFFEPWPHKESKHLHCRNCWCREKFYRSNRVRWNQSDHWSITRDQLHGKIMRHPRDEEDGSPGQSYLEIVEDILKDGDIASVKVHLIPPAKRAEWLSD